MGIGTYMKGQGATEYLVILAVVLIIALVAIGIISQQASGSGAAEKNARIYWKSEVYPVSIDDYKYSNTTLTLMLNNRGSDAATITKGNPTGGGISVLSGTSVVTGPDGSGTQTVVSGSPQTVTISGMPSCSGTFSVLANITYSTASISSTWEVGKKPLVGSCS